MQSRTGGEDDDGHEGESVNRVALPILAALGVLWLGGCEEDDPTGVSPELIPVTPVTISVELPWETVGADARLFDGFGRTSQVGDLPLATNFEGVLNSRALVRVGRFNRLAEIADSTGEVGVTVLVVQGGRLITRFDTLAGLPEGVRLQGSRTVTEWDPATATWELAVDSIGDQRAWEEPGAGASTPVGMGEWDSEDGDSVIIEVDSATVEALVDTLDPARGLMLELLDDGDRIEVTEVELVVIARPLNHPDTLVEAAVEGGSTTFIYDPRPTPGDDALLVGGVPAWRTVLELEIPDIVDGPPELCAIVTCPFELDPEQVNAASLVLTSRQAGAGFRPRDSLRMDIRPVLAPDLLPKSPLGATFLSSAGRHTRVGAEAFTQGGGAEAELPITSFVRDQLRDSTEGGGEPATTVSVLSIQEPLSFDLGWFDGPTGAIPPFVRILLTISDTLRIR